MSIQKTIKLDDGPDSAAAVKEYLKNHRDFFSNHPDALAAIEVPHGSGRAVSLIERQVAMLRRTNKQLKARLLELINVAKLNEKLSQRIHRLTVRLMEASNQDQVFSVLYQGLSIDFSADHVAARIFAESITPRREFVGKADAQLAVFREALGERKPICGRLTQVHLQALFGDAWEEIGSAALLPLCRSDWGGVLAVGARDPERYSRDMGVEMLTRLGDIASVVLDRWVKR